MKKKTSFHIYLNHVCMFMFLFTLQRHTCQVTVKPMNVNVHCPLSIGGCFPAWTQTEMCYCAIHCFHRKQIYSKSRIQN